MGTGGGGVDSGIGVGVGEIVGVGAICLATVVFFITGGGSF